MSDDDWSETINKMRLPGLVRSSVEEVDLVNSVADGALLAAPILVAWGPVAVPAVLVGVEADYVRCRLNDSTCEVVLPLAKRGVLWTEGTDPDSSEAHAMFSARALDGWR
jgi:hypothetical protein